MRKLSFVGMVLAGGFLGSLLVSVVTHFVYTARYPHIIEDGQYGMIFMATVPLGWLLGSAAGAIAAWQACTHPRRAGLVTGLLIVGGVMAGPALGLIGIMAVSCVWLLFHPNG